MGSLKKIADFFGLTPAQRLSIYPINIRKMRSISYMMRFKRCGWGTSIDKFTNVRGKQNVEIGEFCVVNSFVHIWAGKSGVKIGNRVMIASHTSITTLTHDYTNQNMRFISAVDRAIIIEDDAWIGTHVVILPGVTIGKGAVIGAGSVVTKSVPANAIAVGTPVRVVKYRN